MRSIVTVLKAGDWVQGDITRAYGPAHVRWLSQQAQRWTPTGTRFYCLTNLSSADFDIPGVERIPLVHDWPGWWSKMELFQHDLGPVLYLDLDTVIVGPLDELLAHPHRFTTFSQSPHRYACHPEWVPPSRILNSGIMAWDGARPDVYAPFLAQPERWMAHCVQMPYCWGDQGFLHLFLDEYETWEDLFPGAVASFKWELGCQPPHPACRIVSFEGNPKPWDIQEPWIPRLLSTCQYGDSP
jgi:hypothetical protein